MTKPGPRPVYLEVLKSEALKWGNYLLMLRDGQLGTVQKVEWGPDKMIDLGSQKVNVRTVLRVLSAEPFLASTTERELPPLLQVNGLKKDWIVTQPVVPARQIWDQLKKARTTEDIQQVAAGITEWGQQIQKRGHSLPPEFSDVFRSYSRELLMAKKLPHYPRSNRKRSDDKRIDFFAKVLAGLTRDRSPSYALKRLSGWRCPEGLGETSTKIGLELMKVRLQRQLAYQSQSKQISGVLETPNEQGRKS